MGSCHVGGVEGGREGCLNVVMGRSSSAEEPPGIPASRSASSDREGLGEGELDAKLALPERDVLRDGPMEPMLRRPLHIEGIKRMIRKVSD